MASIAQAVTTSISGATNQGGANPAAVAPATLPVPAPDGAIGRLQDTVNLTETGGRNVAVGAQNGKATPAPAFQVTYFPPSSAPGAKTASAQGSETQTAAAVPAQTNNPTAQVANVAAEAAASSAAANGTGAGSGAGATTASSQISPLSAASQAKLQKVDQVLQQLGINPSQISFADRIALLPLANDPAAIQQYIQGLPTQTAVLSPATSQVLAPSIENQPSTAAGNQAGAVAGFAGDGSNSAEAANAATGALSNSAGVSARSGFNPAPESFAAAVAQPARSTATTGQKVNISV